MRCRFLTRQLTLMDSASAQKPKGTKHASCELREKCADQIFLKPALHLNLSSSAYSLVRSRVEHGAVSALKTHECVAPWLKDRKLSKKKGGSISGTLTYMRIFFCTTHKPEFQLVRTSSFKLLSFHFLCRVLPICKVVPSPACNVTCG